MKKVHTLILALSASIALHSQSVLNFTACTSGTITINSVEIGIDQNNNVFISNSNGLLKSTDGGITFSMLHAGSGFGSFVCLGNKIFSTTLYSNDNGSTWSTNVISGSPTVQKKFVKVNETVAYAFTSTSANYIKTIDGGLTWNPFTLPTGPSSTFVNFNDILKLNNGDFMIPYSNGTNFVHHMISKDNLATYSYSISNTFTSTPYKSGFVDVSGKYILLGSNGNIDGYNQNQNYTAPTFTNNYTLSGSTNSVSSFGSGVILSTSTFLVIDKNATTNGVLRTNLTQTVTSIDELNKLTVSLYPNPCINNITINGLDKEYNYIINNQLGQKVLQGSTSQQLNTSTLMPGIYFLNIENQKVVKFIKE